MPASSKDAVLTLKEWLSAAPEEQKTSAWDVKLAAHQRQAIRKRVERGDAIKAVAIDYGITSSAVSNIMRKFKRDEKAIH